MKIKCEWIFAWAKWTDLGLSLHSIFFLGCIKKDIDAVMAFTVSSILHRPNGLTYANVSSVMECQPF